MKVENLLVSILMNSNFWNLVSQKSVGNVVIYGGLISEKNYFFVNLCLTPCICKNHLETCKFIPSRFTFYTHIFLD